MAAVHDLIKQVEDPRLRERIKYEWETASRQKKFGLVYEQHLPELVPIYSATPRRGDLVVKRGRPLNEAWRVQFVTGNAAALTLPRKAGRYFPAERLTVPLADLVVVKQFGEPIFPTLTTVDAVQNGPESGPWHTLIEADNFHALQLLEYLYAGRVDCIYIDPPYNSGARDWKYNNDYVDENDTWRHSKWLSFMEKRLRLAKLLLKPDTGVLICTIDEHEVHHLGVLMAEVFPSSYRQMVTIVINPKGVTQGRYSRVEEHALFAFGPNAFVKGIGDDLLSFSGNGSTRSTKPRWKGLLRSGTNARRQDRKNMFFPVLVDVRRGAVIGTGDVLPFETTPELGRVKDGIGQAWPIRTDGRLGNWGVGRETLNKLIKMGYVAAGRYDPKRNTYGVTYLSAKLQKQIELGGIEIVEFDETKNKVVVEYREERERQLKSVWHRSEHDAGAHGSDLLRNVLGENAFTFPKSVYAVKAISSVTRENKKAIVIDFFAGSGTTLNAVNLLNVADGGQRQCILVTNNEVASEEIQTLNQQGHQPGDVAWEAKGICKSVTWPRSKFTILGRRDDGTPLTGDYTTGRLVEKEKLRTFRHLIFVTAEKFRLPDGLDDKTCARVAGEIVRQQKAIVTLIDGLPQNAVTEGCRFIAREGDKAAVLFDPAAVDDRLAALDEQDQMTEFFITTAAGTARDRERQFKSIES